MSRLPPESADHAAGQASDVPESSDAHAPLTLASRLSTSDTSDASDASPVTSADAADAADALHTPPDTSDHNPDLEPTDVPLLPPDGHRASAKAKASRARRNNGGRKGIDLGLQGGGAHGAYTWGVLDKLLEDGRLEFEGISGASAGTMNAVVLAHGLLDRPNVDPREKAREALHSFWLGVSQAGSSATAWAQTVFSWLNGRPTEYPVWHDWMQSMQQWMMPFAQPPAEINPLRTVLEAQVDFERLRESTATHLFVSATNIRTGNIRIFRTHEITLDVAMASACLPWLFKPVKIDEDFYWDGGYLGNPPLYPFYYETVTSDILIVHINPIERKEKPVLPGQIMNRVNEITFNASLQREFRAISFVHKLLDEGWLKPEFRDRLKYPLIHSIRADKELYDLSSSTKFVTDWHFLTTLRDRGREAAERWLAAHFDDVGVRSTVDLKRDYLQRLPDATAIKA